MFATVVEPRASQMERLQRQQRLALAFASLGLRTDELQPLLDEVVRAGVAGLAGTSAAVLEHVPATEDFVLRADEGWAPGTIGHTRIGADSPAGRAFRTGEPVVCGDDAVSAPNPSFNRGVRQAVCVPIETGTWRFGVLEVHGAGPEAFTADDTVFLQLLAATLARALLRERRSGALRESQAFVRGVLEASPDCVKVLSAEGRVEFMNRHGLEMNEFASLENVLGRPFADLWPEDGRPAIVNAVARAAGGETARVHGSCPTVSGQVRWWELTLAPLEPGHGRPRQVICISRDVTERHEAEVALRESEWQLREANGTLAQRVEDRAGQLARSEAQRQAYFDATPEQLCLFRVLETGLVYEDINTATEQAWGLSRSAVIGRTPLEIVGAATAASIEGHVSECLQRGEMIRYEVTRELPGGTIVVSVLLVPIELPGGGGRLVLLCGRDVTEQRQAEGALRQSQKMEAVGQLTGGIAHDFNNLLAGIGGSLELLSRRVAQGRYGELERFITAAQGAATRAAALTHRLLAFSRQQTLEPKRTEANALVAELEDLIQRTAGPAVAVRTHLAEDLWVTLCDPNQLENALLNLAINARDAMPDGGRLTIGTANVEVEAAFADMRDMPAGQYVGISVTDTGMGMSAEVIARAFDPFFTTKPIGKGTGLGLSMIYGFAKQSGGQVRIHSVESVGTTVSMFLPRHAGPAAVERGAGVALGAAGSAVGTVMVVDDEATVRMVLREALEEQGYAVMEAEEALAGLRMLDTGMPVDLLITDVGLPGGMNGRQLADAARTQRPGLRVLFITGYAESAMLDGGDLAEGMEVLVKPFAMEGLAARVRGMIAG